MFRKKHKYEAERFARDYKLVRPFFWVLGIMTVISFIIPLRPTQSFSEKRNLAEFPEFSLTALADGSYFGDITLWFSDTFPGRESWISLSTEITALHGHSEISIQGDLSVNDAIPVETVQMQAPVQQPEEDEPPAVTQPMQEQETVPAETEAQNWGGIKAEEYEVSNSAVVQIGDTAFNVLGFTRQHSDQYVDLINRFADVMEDQGVQVISCIAPTAIGVMVDPEYLELLQSAPQDDMLEYLQSNMNDNIVKVDTVSELLKHNNEYLFFRTDHHWTALGAYYAYVAFCDAMGYEAEPLDAFREWNQGDFKGSIYYKAKYPTKLKVDEVIAYVPDDDIVCTSSKDGWNFYDTELIADRTTWTIDCRYLCFLSGGTTITKVVNNDLPDAPKAVVVIDSFGNAFVPFLAQHYSTIYAIDYRKYTSMNLQQFCELNDIDQVIVAPYMMTTQSSLVTGLFSHLYGV